MSLLCPACKRPMVTIPVGRAEIDFCRAGCKGLWFDPRELALVDERVKGFDDVLREALEAAPRIRPNQPVRCPRCQTAMHPQIYRRTGVVADTCYVCGGFFLDSGELQQIRELTGTARVRECERMRQELKDYPSPKRFGRPWSAPHEYYGRSNRLGHFLLTCIARGLF